MFIDSSNLKNKYEVVIIGGGISGLSLVRRLSEIYDKSILLVEAGDMKYSSKTNKKSYGISKRLGNWPVKNYSSFYSRLRVFGGNAHIWGGWCMELDEYDYENNDIWKYHKKELQEEYKTAYKILNINPRIIDVKNSETEGLSPYTINISQGNFIKESINELQKSTQIDVILNTELSKINFKNDKVKSIELNNKFTPPLIVDLNKLVLSSGGLENTKILLRDLPNQYQSDNLGRFFMEHPQVKIGRLVTKNKKFNNFLSDFSPPTVKHLFDDKLDLDSKKYFSAFVNTNSNSRGYFVLRSSNVYQSKSLYRLRHIILTRSFASIGPIRFADLFFLTRDIIYMIFKKVINLISKNKSYFIVVHLEQFPHKENRITLDSENTLFLNWELQKSDIENFKCLLRDIEKVFKDNSETKIILNKELINGESSMLEYLNKNLFGIGHHMGTTRMGIDGSNAVCNLDFQLNEVKNLYLNSTSVFPSGGIANPTLTLIALSSMLAKRIKSG